MAGVALIAAVDAVLCLNGTTALTVPHGEVVILHIETTGPDPRASTGLVRYWLAVAGVTKSTVRWGASPDTIRLKPSRW